MIARNRPGPRRGPSYLLAAMGLLILPGAASPSCWAAHPISVTEADAYVARTKTTMRVSVFLEDVYLFQDLQPDEQGVLDAQTLREGAQRHRQFVLERIKVLDVHGQPLTATLTNYQPPDIPAEGVPAGELMRYSLEFQLEYAYAEAPEFLTFQQEMVDENFLFPSEMKLHVKQAGEDAPRLAMLRPSDPYTVRFDWSRPPLTQEATDQEWEQWLKKEREETLGITSYSSVYSFIYITEQQVRHEVLIPLASLARIIPIERRDPNFLDVDEQSAAAQAIHQYLQVGNPVQVDDQRIAPRFDRTDFYGLDLRDFARQAEPQRVSMASGRVGVILSYPAPQPPLHRVEVTWDQFSSSIRNIESVVFAGEEALKFSFSQFQEDNTFRWETEHSAEPPPQVVKVELTPPRSWSLRWVPSALLAAAVLSGAGAWLSRRKRVFISVALGLLLLGLGAGRLLPAEMTLPWTRPPLPAPETLQQVFGRLQDNTYRAFSFLDENQIYDALAISVDGPLLRDLYLRIQESLQMQEQGGALSTIEDIRRLDGQAAPDGNGGFLYRCRWNVKGVIEHWGHIHRRTNQYAATFHIQPRDGCWKITAMDITDQQRIGFATSLRKF